MPLPRATLLPRASLLPGTTTAPPAVPFITNAPTHLKISTLAGFRTTEFRWAVPRTFVEFKIKIVESPEASHESGSVIPETNGSVNTIGAGEYPANEDVTSVIDGRDLALVSGDDGSKVVKIFARNENGRWSS
jgi:hypothetical protein